MRVYHFSEQPYPDAWLNRRKVVAYHFAQPALRSSKSIGVA